MISHDLVSCSQTQPTTKEGSCQPTVLAFIMSLARLLAVLVGDKPLIISTIKISIFIPSKPALRIQFHVLDYLDER